MAGPYDLTGQNIENTYQRVLQTPNGTTFYDGTGSLVTLTATAVAGGSNTQVQFNSASLLSGSSNFSFDYVNNNMLLTGSLLVTQSHISTVDYIDFTVLPSPPGFNTGRLHWTDDTKTLQIDTDVNNFEIELGHQNVVRGRNITGYTLTKGMIVYINGESGNRPTFTTASWEGDPSSASTLGFIAQDINDSQTGYVVTNGILRGINTNAYTPGTQLYLSSSGQYTSIVPISPNNEVRLGKTITQATNGYIYVDIMNGYELGELHDVLIVSQSTGDLLMWNSGSKVWINTKTLSGSYSLSGSLTTNDGLSVQSLTASFISASNITGSLFGTASYIPVGGSDQQIQFNSGSTFSGNANFVYVYASSSLQQGDNTNAIGIFSHAEGHLTQTAGDYSHAEGRGTTSIGGASHAEGDTTQTGTTVGYSASFANGTGSLDSIYGDLTADFSAGSLLYLNDVDYDYVFGTQTFIIGGSYFNGTNTEIYIVNVVNSTTKAIIGNISAGVANWLGDQTLGGPYSHTEGSYTISLGYSSHVEGYYNAAVGSYSHAEGGGAQAIGDYSHAEGSGAQAIGNYSHAEGEGNLAIGEFSHTEGTSTIAGTYAYVSSTTSGIITLNIRYRDVSAQFITTHIIFNDGSQTFYLELDPLNPPYFDGTNTILTLVDTTFTSPKTIVAIPGNLYPPFADYTISEYSHTKGEFTQTYGRASHAAGLSTIAVADYQHVIGKYNLQTNGALFVIGNGTGDGTRSNLLIASGSKVQITGSLNVTGGITGSLNGSSSYASTASYVNGNITKANIAAAGTFGGIPLTASITFATAFPNTNYSIVITGEDARTFTVQNKLAGGFEINTNSSITLTGNTYWQAVSYGEFNS